MKDILLAAVNARYNHTNIAVRSISLYCGVPELAAFGEWTINQPVLEILRGITEYHPKIILFSTYIWNIDITLKVMRELPKVLPGCVMGAGGPEAGYRAEQLLQQERELDFVIAGEGEQTVAELVRLYKTQQSAFYKTEYMQAASLIAGIYAGDTDSCAQRHITYSGPRCLLSDMSTLPFPYPEITDPDNRIYYYESSRGCPFSCAYCMSSLDKRVRFMPLDRVYRDLQRFLDARVKLVKFVDRTYNLEPERYIAIWKYICAHHNGITMFHFEIEAEYLSTEALDFLQTVPEGIMQFEIGVQTANQKTLEAVQRSGNINALAENVRRIPKTIHMHLDLIAGLPYENLASFGNSFNWTLALDPDALQLGFLKVLYGTTMESYCKKNGWKWMSDAPYEVLSTPELSYEDISFLKDIEILLDAYWNSHNFEASMHYVQRHTDIWQFFSMLAGYCRKQNIFTVLHKPLFWYELLTTFSAELSAYGINSGVLHELVRFDFISGGKKGNFPAWCGHRYNKDAHRQALETHTDFHSTRTAYSLSEYDVFSINPAEPEAGGTDKQYPVLFLYGQTPHEKTKTVFL